MRTKCASAAAWARPRRRLKRERAGEIESARGESDAPCEEVGRQDRNPPLGQERHLHASEAEGDAPRPRIPAARAADRPAGRSGDSGNGPAGAALGRDREGLVHGRKEGHEKVRLRESGEGQEQGETSGEESGGCPAGPQGGAAAREGAQGKTGDGGRRPFL